MNPFEEVLKAVKVQDPEDLPTMDEIVAEVKAVRAEMHLRENGLVRFWFEFDCTYNSEFPTGIGYGCGITAFNYDDAIFLLKEKVFLNKPIAPLKTVVENIDVSTLDAGHVLPNMPVPTNARGIWYPSGYSDYFSLPNVATGNGKK